MMKKMLSLFLAIAMILSLAVSVAAEGEWSVVCGGLGSAHSENLAITTEIQSWTFTSTTNAEATNNWEAAAVDVYDAAGWALTIRSDSFAVSVANNWGTAGEDAFGGKSYPADWIAWLDANKAGAACTVTAQLVDGDTSDYIVIAFANNGVANTYIVPTASLENVSLALTGEKCVLTNLSTTTEHIDISAAVASVTPAEPEQPTEPSEPEQPTEPSEPEQPTEPSEPEQPTEPSEPEQPSEPEEGETADWVVDCPAWWGGHSPAVIITEEKQSWTFTSTTYASAADNWDTASLVVWRSDDGAMHTIGENGYLEELLVRSDCFAVSEEAFWGTAGQPSYSSKNYPSDWAAWLDANKAGATCTVTAQLVDGWIVVGFSNNGVTNVYSVPMNTKSDSPVYLSLTGEECTISGWRTTTDHLNISAATSAPADGTNPATGDTTNLVGLALACVLSLGGLAVLTKKRFSI